MHFQPIEIIRNWRDGGSDLIPFWSISVGMSEITIGTLWFSIQHIPHAVLLLMGRVIRGKYFRISYLIHYEHV